MNTEQTIVISDKQLGKDFSGVREAKAVVFVRRLNRYEVSTVWLYEYFPMAAEVTLNTLVNILRDQKAEFWVFDISAMRYTTKLTINAENEDTPDLAFWSEAYGLNFIEGSYYFSVDGIRPRYIVEDSECCLNGE